jgi:aryl-alcohol dehydrogenase-like predicted oxidoreductase
MGTGCFLLPMTTSMKKVNQAFYWGTSEWSAREIEEAHAIADKLGLIAPIAEQ